jgi:small-conductance mechanosensitive channel
MDSARLDQIIRSGVVLAGVAVAWLLLTRAASHYLARVGRGDGIEETERRQRAKTLWTGIRRVILAILIVTVALTVMNIWEIPIGSFVAIGSAVGVAVGLGAQSVVKDIIAGFLILVENQFALGDVVKIAGVAGSVEQMRLRVTVLRDLDGYVHHIPNGAIGVASNYTSEFARVVVTVGVSYASDIDRVLAVFTDELGAIAAEMSDRILEAPQVLGVEELGNSSILIRALMVVAPTERWSIRRETLRRIKVRFDAEHIEIPFPQMTVHIKDGTDPAG